jgi:hypothetical protein
VDLWVHDGAATTVTRRKADCEARCARGADSDGGLRVTFVVLRVDHDPAAVGVCQRPEMDLEKRRKWISLRAPLKRWLARRGQRRSRR